MNLPIQFAGKEPKSHRVALLFCAGYGLLQIAIDVAKFISFLTK